MVKLKDILDIELLKKHIHDGVVRSQHHPEYPNLHILNYTEVAQYDRIWDNVTNVCRGLIIDVPVVPGHRPDKPVIAVWEEIEVIARGYNKFHNLNTDYVPETQEANLPHETPLVTEKLDGSMGILYYWHGWKVATRGSFASEQAKWATEWLTKQWSKHWVNPPSNLLLTPIVEIIYPENRIVVNYDYSGLVLTGMIWKDTGKEYSRLALEEWGQHKHLPVVKQFDKSLAQCAAENVSNEEGYVLTYPSTGLKVKVKFEEYVRLHRILTGLNPRAIWEMLIPVEMLIKMQLFDPKTPDTNRRSSVDAILADPKMPAGFVEWFGGWVRNLRNAYAEMEAEARAVFNERPLETDMGRGPLLRRAQAIYFQKAAPELTSICFAMLDGKDYEPIIWKQLKPRGDAETFKKDGE